MPKAFGAKRLFYRPRTRGARLDGGRTLIAESHASDEEYEAARVAFSEQELVNLTMAIVTINGWNRLAIYFREVPGNYEPQQHAK